jgi:hypothetical protein
MIRSGGTPPREWSLHRQSSESAPVRHLTGSSVKAHLSNLCHISFVRVLDPDVFLVA